MIPPMSSCIVQGLPTAETDPLAALLASSLNVVPTSCSQEAYDWSDIAFIIDHSVTRNNWTNVTPRQTAVSLLQQSSCRFSDNDEVGAEMSIRTQKSPLTYRSNNDEWLDLDKSDLSTSDSSDEEDTESSLSSLESKSDIATLAKKNTRSVKNQRRVSFSNFVQIRSHNITVGDHPCCRGGMALSCDWDRAEEDEMVDLDIFEATSPKRRAGELRLTFSQRRRRLQECTGMSMSQLMHIEYEILFPCSSSSLGQQELGRKQSCRSFSSKFGGSQRVLHASPSVERALAEATESLR